MNREEMIYVIQKMDLGFHEDQIAEMTDVSLKVVIMSSAKATTDPTLPKLLDALGWQGGTVADALAEVRRLKALDVSMDHRAEFEDWWSKTIPLDVPTRRKDEAWIIWQVSRGIDKPASYF